MQKTGSKKASVLRVVGVDKGVVVANAESANKLGTIGSQLLCVVSAHEMNAIRIDQIVCISHSFHS